MWKFIYYSSILITGFQSSQATPIPYTHAPTSITLHEGQYTSHVRAFPTHEVKCISDTSSIPANCPSLVHCYRPPHSILTNQTKWTCDIKGTSQNSNSRLWKIKSIKWEDTHTSSSSEHGNFFNQNTFHVEFYKTVQPTPPTFIDTLIGMTIIALFFGSISYILSGLNIDFGDFMLGAIAAVFIMSFSPDNTTSWSSQSDVPSSSDD